MTKVVEAIYTNGHLEPLEPLGLAEKQRVRLIVQPVEWPAPAERQAALKRLQERIEKSDFFLRGPLPSRNELHERR